MDVYRGVCSTFLLHWVCANALPLCIYFLFIILLGKVPACIKVNSGHGSWQRFLLFNWNQWLKLSPPNIWLADVSIVRNDRDPALRRKSTRLLSFLPKPDTVLLDSSVQMTCSQLPFKRLNVRLTISLSNHMPLLTSPSLWPRLEIDLALPEPGWLPEDPRWGWDSDRFRFPWQLLQLPVWLQELRQVI